MQNFAFKFQAVAEKTAKIVRGLLYFGAPCIFLSWRTDWMQPVTLWCSGHSASLSRFY